MEKISNRTIAMLLIATIAIYLGGTFISLNKLADIGYMSTGFAAVDNESGQLSLNIQSLTDIVWVVGTVQWGTGYVDSSCNNCTMYVNGTMNVDGGTTPTANFDTTCCQSFNWSNVSLILRNQGNQDVSLGFNVTEDADIWFGTDTPRNLSFKIVPSFQRPIDTSWDDVADTVDPCTGNSTHVGGWSFIGKQLNTTVDGAPHDITSWIPLADFDIPPALICGGASAYNFTGVGTANEVSFDFKVVIPQAYTGTGAKSISVLAQGTN